MKTAIAVPETSIQKSRVSGANSSRIYHMITLIFINDVLVKLDLNLIHGSISCVGKTKHSVTAKNASS